MGHIWTSVVSVIFFFFNESLLTWVKSHDGGRTTQALGLPLTSVVLDYGLQGLVNIQVVATPPLRTSCSDSHRRSLVVMT